MDKSEDETKNIFSFGRNDFILIKSGTKILEPLPAELNETIIYNYSFYTKMAVAISEFRNRKILLIGEIFSAETPLASNQDIADLLSQKETFGERLTALQECTGRFLLFEISEKEIQFVGDALGQFEVYYSKDFSGIASNLSILSRFIKLRKWEGAEEKLYSKIARTTQIQIGMTTAFVDSEHLMPNHFAISTSMDQARYFPTKSTLESTLTLEEATDQIEKLMRNFSIAIQNRFKLAMPLTAGRDSRFLLSLFKDFDLKLFVFKHPHVSEDHYDIKTGKKLASDVQKDYDIIKYKGDIDEQGKAFLATFSEKPRDNPIPYLVNAYPALAEYMIINGHGGEIGRSFYGKVFNPNPKKFATILGYPKNRFVEVEMEKWLNDINQVGNSGENLVDYFYWEQRMGNWGARIKTETANVVDMVAPMNSHAVLMRFLAVPKQYRKFYSNDLFNELIRKINPDLLKHPFNPSQKNKIIGTLINLRIYWIYRNIRLFIRTYL